jgi:hypothetical protein
MTAGVAIDDRPLQGIGIFSAIRTRLVLTCSVRHDVGAQGVAADPDGERNRPIGGDGWFLADVQEASPSPDPELVSEGSCSRCTSPGQRFNFETYRRELWSSISLRFCRSCARIGLGLIKAGV